MNTPSVSVIIVSYNVRPFLDLCLDSVFRALEGISGEVFVVDNNSSDGSPEMVVNRYPHAHLIHNRENLGFAKANNQAVALSQGTFIHFLNPDTVLPEDFYRKGLTFMETHPDAGCVGPKLIDGKGAFAVDSKKSFPSFWTSVYKVTGLSKLLKNSPKFNRYYRADISEDQTAIVEILSGCCLLVRKTAMEKAGGSFDEGYFMFGEDVDLCHRIGSSGFKNYYYPEIAIIHYKGESTRKLSLQYMKIFYKAHVRLVKRYYPPKAATLYINALRVILIIRNLFYVAKHFVSRYRLPLLDTLCLILISLVLKNIWFNHMIQTDFIPAYNYFPVLLWGLLCWLGCLFLSGAYDKPFSLFKAGRGMLIGTLIATTGCWLIGASGALMFISGMTGFGFILLMRWLLGAIGWIPLPSPKGNLKYRAALISNEGRYEQTITTLKKRPYYATIVGRIAPNEETRQANTPEILGHESDLQAIQQQFQIDELIFNGGSLPYKRIIHWMQACSKNAHFKIQSSKSLAFIGSHADKHPAEVYFTRQGYTIETSDARRNKRMIDIALSLIFLLLFPVIRRKVEDRQGFWINIKSVMTGKKTWVGYEDDLTKREKLPSLRNPVVPPYKIMAQYNPDEQNRFRLAAYYARNYTVSNDLALIRTNFKYLGRASIRESLPE